MCIEIENIDSVITGYWVLALAPLFAIDVRNTHHIDEAMPESVVGLEHQGWHQEGIRPTTHQVNNTAASGQTRGEAEADLQSSTVLCIVGVYNSVEEGPCFWRPTCTSDFRFRWASILHLRDAAMHLSSQKLGRCSSVRRGKSSVNEYYFRRGRVGRELSRTSVIAGTWSGRLCWHRNFFFRAYFQWERITVRLLSWRLGSLKHMTGRGLT